MQQEDAVAQPEALELLRTALGRPTAEFRSGQWEAIDTLVNGRRRLLEVQATGWGKSFVYFISTSLLRRRGAGPTLIISPLLALMRNQIAAAERLGVRAVSINSSNRQEWSSVVAQILRGDADAVLISPERLSNDAFVSDVLLPMGNQVGLIVVDEAHCISDWGHDFRPDYRRLVQVLRRMPPTLPVLATTATANQRVIDDIRVQLGEVTIHRGSLMRQSLALQTVRLPTQAERLAWLAEYVPLLPGTGIIYTLTKRDADQVTAWLNGRGVSARAYYSGVTGDDEEGSDGYRQELENLLLQNEIKALVATTALGMGYDKPDLGFVVHYQAPGSIVAYYQQVGRAGRAIDRAIGVLLSGHEDEIIHQYFRTSAFPTADLVRSILGEVEASDGLSINQLQAIINAPRSTIERALLFLSVENPSPVIKQGTRWYRTAAPWSLDTERIARLTNQRSTEWQEVQAYLNTDGCLMEFLARALDDVTHGPCGRCAHCAGEAVVPNRISPSSIAEASRFLRQAELPLRCNIQVAAGAFDQYGLKGNLPAELRAEEGRVLARWGDAGWGTAVADDKHRDHFRDELVTASAEMVRQRWNPTPAPTWVTCIPSRQHPGLVPDFARRLAGVLGIPFVDTIQKVRDNAPQKLQRNRYHQARNLDGVFQVVAGVPNGPVLLIDDVVDSGWTLTLAAALLRRAGSGEVFPFALATTAAAD